VNLIPGWEDALQGFKLFKRAQGLRESTLTDYERFVRQFFRRCQSDPWPNEARLYTEGVNFLGQPGIKPSTYNLRLTYLKNFFAYAVDQGYLSWNPLKDFKVRPTSPRVVQLAPETLQELLELPPKDTFVGIRDRALLLLTLDCGIRPKEAFGLFISDVNFKTREVYIRAEVSKTKTPRVLPISAVTASAIRQLILARHPDWGESTPLFCTEDGRPMGRNAWKLRLEKYSEKLGEKIRPYDLRHSFALYFLRNGGNSFAFQRLLGHTTMDMTKTYVHLAEGDIQAQHDMATPLNTLLEKKRPRVRKVHFSSRKNI